MNPYLRPPRWLRERLFARSGGHCERAGCVAAITLQTMHVAHLRARASGGPLIEENVAAWCAPCNLKNGPRDVADGRKLPRAWQLEALEVIVKELMESGAATLSTAPGAGKTLFAGLVFERLHELELVDRMVVLVPRRTLVEQWVGALAVGRHLELRPHAAYERQETAQQVGVVVTYQSLLNAEQRQNHREHMARRPTLLVLDEVHHVGEPSGLGRAVPAWAQYVRDLAGTVEPPDLHVAAVLNLSGTLWRSNPGERISTVRYDQLPNGRLQSCVDYDIPAEHLIWAGDLRPVDIFRLGARVEINDFANLKVIDSHIADLDVNPARAALGKIATDPAWRTAFVGAVLDRLQAAHRSLDGHPVKALIVAASQKQARMMRDTADTLMVERGLRPMATLAISDEPEAADVLDAFRKADRPGVLCTVDMAGEGYDCPDIAVIGFASNKLTPLYVRQVVARAQRVTDREREQGRPIPATVVLPDTAELVGLLVSILKPMHHEYVPLPEPVERPPRPDGKPHLPAFTLEAVRVEATTVNVTGVEDGEIAGVVVTSMEGFIEELGLRVADTSRFIVASRRWAQARRRDQPFDPLHGVEQALEGVGEAGRATATATAPAAPPARRPMLEEARAARALHQLHRAAGWWIYHGPPGGSVEHFNADVNQAGNIPGGGRQDASIDQLERARDYALQRIYMHCDAYGVARPNVGAWLPSQRSSE